MFEFEKSICGCSLQTGSKIIGWLDVFGYLIGILFTCLAFSVASDERSSTLTSDQRSILKAVLWTVLITYVICFVASIIMLYGAYKKKAGLLLPWLIIKTIAIILSVGTGIIRFVKVEGGFELFVSIISAVISIYLILVVYNFYRQLTGQLTSHA